jgi:predicted metalloprotease
MEDQDESRNVEDVRGSSGGFRPAHGIGLGTLVLVLIVSWVLGINPLRVLGLLSGQDSTLQTAPTQPGPPANGADPQVKFVSQILRSTEVVWGRMFQEKGLRYEEPHLRLYRDS